MSKKHLPACCSEFNFRWNERDTTDGERMMRAMIGAEGKRLTYRPPKGSKLKEVKHLIKPTPEQPMLDVQVERIVEPMPEPPPF